MRSINIYLSLFLISLLFSFNSCTTKSSAEHWIDNPTDKEIVINIDGTDITIPAQSGINYNFEFGKHTLTYNGSSVNFMAKPPMMACIINPTQSNYIFYKNMYVNEADERATESYMAWLKKQISSETTIILNDSLQTMPLPFQIVNDLFIEEINYNWDYYLEETIPANVVLRDALVTKRNRSLADDPNYQAGKFQTVKSKIFRETEFLDYLKESGVEDNIQFPKNIVRYEELPKVKMATINLDSIACPPGKEAVELALEHWDRLLTLKGTDFAKEYEIVSNLRHNVLTQSLEIRCEKEYDGDYSAKAAMTKVMKVTSSLSYLNFFIVE